jgi:hypothetical protein
MATRQDKKQGSMVPPIEIYRQSSDWGVVAELSHARIAEALTYEEGLRSVIVNCFGAKPLDPFEAVHQPEPPQTELSQRALPPEVSADPAVNYNNTVSLEAQKAQARPDTPEYNLAQVRASIDAAFNEAA